MEKYGIDNDLYAYVNTIVGTIANMIEWLNTAEYSKIIILSCKIPKFSRSILIIILSSTWINNTENHVSIEIIHRIYSENLSVMSFAGKLLPIGNHNQIHPCSHL